MNTLKRLLFNPKFLLTLGILFILYTLVFDQGMGFIRQYKLTMKNRELRQEIEHAREIQKKLQQDIERLEHDLTRIKQEAIKAGYAEPDEIIINIRD